MEPHHKVASNGEWEAARKAFLMKEKAHQKATMALAAERQSLPWRKITKDYSFIPVGETGTAPVHLRDLFTHGSQLVIQHQMFDDSWDRGCPMCSAWTEQFSHLLPFIFTHCAFAVVCSATPQKLQKFRKEKRWEHVPFFSQGALSEFGHDFKVSFTEDEIKSGDKLYNYGSSPAFCNELFGFSVFKLVEGEIFHTYSTYGAGLSELHSCLKLFDILPDGRNETSNLDWVKHKEDF